MYKMIKALSHRGEDKLDSIAAIHSLEGYFGEKPIVGGHIYYVYNDKSGQMMRSSIICSVKHEDNIVKIKTKNTEYWFEELEEK